MTSGSSTLTEAIISTLKLGIEGKKDAERTLPFPPPRPIPPLPLPPPNESSIAVEHVNFADEPDL